MFNELKWGALTLFVAALLASTFWAFDEHKDIVAQDAKIAKHDACLNALSGKGDVAMTCDAAIVAFYDRAKHAAVCDQALDLGATAPECSPVVADLFATNATLKTQLQSTVADRDAAIARAAARAATDIQRKAQDDHALAAAPRQPDGLIVCDADCLRQRFEAAPR